MKSKIEISAQREIVQGYYNKIFYENPDIETILQWLGSDLEHLRGDDAISIVDKIVNKQSHSAEVKEQQGVEIKKLADDMLDVINEYDWEIGDPGAIIASAESTLLKISNLLNNQ